MKNQMIMILNDKETLTKIAADPDTELRIKNNLVDSVVKRVTEKCNKDLHEMVENKMDSALIEMGLIEKIGVYGTKIAGEKLRAILEDRVRLEIEISVNKIIRDEIKKQMDNVKSYIEERTTRWIEVHSISDDSIEKILQESVDRYIKNRLLGKAE